VSSCQISSRSVKPLRMAVFFDFQDGEANVSPTVVEPSCGSVRVVDGPRRRRRPSVNTDTDS